MALENYIEMRDLVDDPDFLLQQALERKLEARHPGRFVPHYSMVTFMRIPYSLALERSNIQRGILTEATRGLESLDGIDWAAVVSEVVEKLPPLIDDACPRLVAPGATPFRPDVSARSSRETLPAVPFSLPSLS